MRWYLHWNSGELQVTSEACSMSTYRSSPKGQPLHQRNSSELSNDAESPKAPSTYFSQTLNSTTTILLNYSTSTNPNLPTLLTYSTTQHIIRYQSQVKPSHTPLEAGISVKTTVDALTAQSVQPQGSHLPKVGGWNPGHRYTLK